MAEAAASARAVNYTADGTAWVEAGSGEALVLVHGVGMNHAVWEPQIVDLADDYRVIAYDLLGHGDSAQAPEPTILAHLRDQLADLLDALGIESAHLVGHSMGSLVALEFALTAPERVQDVVALNPVYRRTESQRAAVCERAQRLASGEAEDAPEATLERWFDPEQRSRSPERVEAVRTWLDQADHRSYARVYTCFAESDQAFVGRLPELTVPALFLTGADDPNSTPTMSWQMASEAPDGRAEFVSGQRHMMAFIEPEAVNPIIRDFLAGRAERTPSAQERSK